MARKTRSAMSLGPGHIKMSSVFTMALLKALRGGWRSLLRRLQLISPDHLFVDEDITGERLRRLSSDKYRRFAHGFGLLKRLWRPARRRHAKHIAWCPYAADRGEDVGTNALRLILHRQTLGEALKG